MEFAHNIWFYIETCCNCGIKFAVTKEFNAACLKDTNKYFFCPSGHSQHYTGPSEETKLRRALEQKDSELLRSTMQLADTKTRLNSVAKAHMRMRTRVANGVCPCCNRTFSNLAQHMRGEHPEFSQPQTLRALRMAFGLTQSDLAREVGTEAPYVSLYEHDKAVPVRAKVALDGWLAAHCVDEKP